MSTRVQSWKSFLGEKTNNKVLSYNKVEKPSATV
jgi:hypothetical protein